MDKIQIHQLLATMSATLVGLIFIAATIHLQTVKETFRGLKEQIPEANLHFPYYILVSSLLGLVFLFIPLYIFLTFFLFEDNYPVRLFFNSIIAIIVLHVIYKTKDYFRGKFIKLMKMTKLIGFFRLIFIPVTLILITILFFFEKPKALNSEMATIISSASIIIGLVFVFMDVFLTRSESLILLVDEEIIDIIRRYMPETIKEMATLKEAIKEKYKFSVSNNIGDIIIALNNKQISEKLKENFQSHGINLYETVKIEKIDNGWEIDNYLIKKEDDNKLNIYESSLDKKKIEKVHERMKNFIDNIFPLVIDSNTIIASELILQLELRDVFVELRKKYG